MGDLEYLMKLAAHFANDAPLPGGLSVDDMVEGAQKKIKKNVKKKTKKNVKEEVEEKSKGFLNKAWNGIKSRPYLKYGIPIATAGLGAGYYISKRNRQNT